MAQTIPISSLLPLLLISICLCFSLLPNLTVAHQTNANNKGDIFVTNLIEKGACRNSTHETRQCIDFVTNSIEKACRRSLEKEVCVDALKLISVDPKGEEGLHILVERTLISVSNITNQTLDHLNRFIKEATTTEGESSSYKQVLANCAENYDVVKFNVDYMLERLIEEDFEMVATRLNYVNEEVKSCDKNIRDQPGHFQSLLINKNSKMIRRFSNSAVAINRLWECSKYGFPMF